MCNRPTNVERVRPAAHSPGKPPLEREAPHGRHGSASARGVSRMKPVGLFFQSIRYYIAYSMHEYCSRDHWRAALCASQLIAAPAPAAGNSGVLAVAALSQGMDGSEVASNDDLLTRLEVRERMRNRAGTLRRCRDPVMWPCIRETSLRPRSPLEWHGPFMPTR